MVILTFNSPSCFGVLLGVRLLFYILLFCENFSVLCVALLYWKLISVLPSSPFISAMELRSTHLMHPFLAKRVSVHLLIWFFHLWLWFFFCIIVLIVLRLRDDNDAETESFPMHVQRSSKRQRKSDNPSRGVHAAYVTSMMTTRIPACGWLAAQSLHFRLLHVECHVILTVP